MRAVRERGTYIEDFEGGPVDTVKEDQCTEEPPCMG